MEIRIFIEIHCGCNCCSGEQDNAAYLGAAAFTEKTMKEIPGLDIKIYPDFSKEYMPYSKGKHKLPLVVVNGKVVSEGEYPETGDLKRLIKKNIK